MERKYQAHQTERENRFRQMMALRAQGLFFADIAKRVGMAERCVRKWVKQGVYWTQKVGHISPGFYSGEQKHRAWG